MVCSIGITHIILKKFDNMKYISINNIPFIMLCYKEVGETTSEFAARIRRERRVPDDQKVAVCGKLDPQAKGVTRVLIGEETWQMPHYLQSNKTYEFSIVLGISTTSDDIMGEIEDINSTAPDIRLVKNFLKNVIMTRRVQKYHPISAKKIRKDSGKKRPLWYWSKRNMLEEGDLPSKPVQVFSLVETTTPLEMNFEEYRQTVLSRLNTITNKDAFNIDKIIEKWNCVKIEKLSLLSYKIKVSSGFYVRMIAKNIKDELHIPVHIFGINRVEVEDI